MKTIHVRGVDLAVREEGSGLPLLLVHGFPLTHAMWREQIGALAPRCRVIAPDLRGFGGSQVTAGAVGMEDFADDLAAMLDALGVREPIVYCGLSAGGYIGWQFFRKHAARVRGLVMCDTRAAADSPEALVGRRKMIDHVLRAGGTQYLAEAMLPKLFAPDSLENFPAAVDLVLQTILAASPEGVAAALRGIAARPDATPLLATINVPACLIVGEHDVLSPPEEMAQIAAAMPQAELVKIPQAGHLAPLENAAEVNATIERFLEKLEQ